MESEQKLALVTASGTASDLRHLRHNPKKTEKGEDYRKVHIESQKSGTVTGSDETKKNQKDENFRQPKNYKMRGQPKKNVFSTPPKQPFATSTPTKPSPSTQSSSGGRSQASSSSEVFGSQSMQDQSLTESVPNYSSLINNSDEAPKRLTKIIRTWRKQFEFEDSVEAIAFVKNEKTWSTATTNNTQEGKKVLYRCSKAKLRGRQCESGLYLLYHAQSEKVSLFMADNNHTCQGEIQSDYGLSCTMKEHITAGFNEGARTRKAIEVYLAKKKLKVPHKNKINNILKQLRVKISGKNVISIGELETIIQKHLEIPDDDNEPFVVDYICSDVGVGDFKVFISSKTLLRNAVDSDVLAADSSYKLLWQGYPISPVGTTDLDRHFHLYGNLISMNERTDDYEFAFNSVKKAVKKFFNHDMAPKVLISDASGAIHNACINVFGSQVIILMCWFHAKKAMKKNLPRWFKTEGQKKEILDDIDKLQLSQSQSIFDRASALFLEKYHEYKEFCDYFRDEWFINNQNWFEGACPQGIFAPSTNNALESFNGKWKSNKSYRFRLPLAAFIVNLLQWTREWSEEYTSGAKVYVITPSLTTKLWTAAYKWVKDKKTIKKRMDEDGLINYQFPASNVKTIDDYNIINIWTTFDEFKMHAQLGWTTFIQDQDHWREGHCNCPVFQKEYICKHLAGLAIRLNYVDVPIEAKTLPLEQKRKKGRPSKAKKALIKQ